MADRAQGMGEGQRAGGQLISPGCSGIRPMNTFDFYIAAERAREAYRTTIAQFEPLLDGTEAEARETARNLALFSHADPDHAA